MCVKTEPERAKERGGGEKGQAAYPGLLLSMRIEISKPFSRSMSPCKTSVTTVALDEYMGHIRT